MRVKVRKGKGAKRTKLHVLKNRTDECWFDEQVREIEKQGDARKALEEYYDEMSEDETEEEG